jgi:hypothetical protein
MSARPTGWARFRIREWQNITLAFLASVIIPVRVARDRVTTDAPELDAGWFRRLPIGGLGRLIVGRRCGLARR